MSRFLPAILFVIAIIYVKPVNNIKCYVCRTDKTSGCAGESLNNSLAIVCPKRPSSSGSFCRKISQQLYFKGEKAVTTIRECAYEKSEKACYKSRWSDAAYLEACECDQDMCNRSPKHAVDKVQTAMIIIIMPLLQKCLIFR